MISEEQKREDNKDWAGYEFVWFIGVVEDRQDPIKLGRVRVRAFGWHNPDLATVPTEALPWAQVVMPVTSAAMDGIGQSPNGLVEGSWVFGFFLDGERAQQPIIMGSINGIPTDQFKDTQGFRDVRQGDVDYGPYPMRRNEPDVTRLARNDANSAPEFHTSRVEGRTEDVDVAHEKTIFPDSEDLNWDEPPNPWNSKYPYNHVYQTESGHVKEYDDTPGSRRIHERHASGTFYEVHDNGDHQHRIVGNRYTIVANTDFVNIKGDCNLTINGNMKIKVLGDYDLEILGNKTETVAGEVVEKFGKTQTTEANTGLAYTTPNGVINLN
jgi:hypothetical protein